MVWVGMANYKTSGWRTEPRTVVDTSSRVRLAMVNTGLAKITGLEVEGAPLISVSKWDPERKLIP
jgi:hypothetical protein